MSLKFDYTITSQEGRAQYVSQFESELSTARDAQLAADYILWGDKGEGDFELNSKWASRKPESLDALLASPAFGEAQLARTPTRAIHSNLDRDLERSRADASTLAELESLWSQIDETEFKLNLWELACGKRSTPPRPSLCARLSPYTRAALQREAERLDARGANQLKALLVELRQTQYTLRDSYAAPRSPQSIPSDLEWDTSVQIEGLPCGLAREDDKLAQVLFSIDPLPYPSQFLDEDLSLLAKRLWRNPDPSFSYIDFRDPQTLHHLFSFREELATSDSSEARAIASTLDFYTKLADLEPCYAEILSQKASKRENQFIRTYINEKYQKRYSENYISTIYRHKILEQIAAAATLHRQILENLFYPENFGTCNTCGKVLLRSTDFFMRKTKSLTGYDTRCKKCQKEKRKGEKTIWTN